MVLSFYKKIQTSTKVSQPVPIIKVLKIETVWKNSDLYQHVKPVLIVEMFKKKSRPVFIIENSEYLGSDM